ncbi:MAG: RNase adapter RapZ [Acidimicrobiia bacterium]
MALDVTIVTGMSGAGRSTAADVLEDLGFFVIDNLPPALIAKVAELARGGKQPQRYALVVDVRSGSPEELLAAVTELRTTGTAVNVLYLDAADDVLVRRFESTRRPHPLSDAGGIADGIARERTLLADLKTHADVVVDTSDLNVHTLRDRLRPLFADADATAGLQVAISSFGFKHGLPLDADMVLDCRFLPNPHWVDELRPLTGLEEPVSAYVLEQQGAGEFVDAVEALLVNLLPAYEREGKAYLSIAFGCTGGRHRSVAIAEELARRFDARDLTVRLVHRDLERV